MSLTIELSDAQATTLQARAEAEGLSSVEAWIQKLAEPQPPAVHPLQTAADIVLARMRKVPAEIMAAMPADGASEHDHYIYGWPKRQA